MSTVYLNGEYLPADQARISPDDRGFLFGDGVYEVVSAYRGKIFGLEGHVTRLARSLSEVRIDWDAGEVGPLCLELLERNGLEDEPLVSIYLQVTRGAAPRYHGFPEAGTPPTVYAFAKPCVRPDRERWEEGYRAVTVPDRRWARADIKTTSLIPNVLAYQAARDAGVDDAIFLRDGVAIEGAAANLFFVFDGTLVTHPVTNLILRGVTRDVVLDLAGELGIPVSERAVQVERLWEADELFLTGTTTEIRPVVEVDGRGIGSGVDGADPGDAAGPGEVGPGEVGPVVKRIYDAFLEATAG